MQYVIVGIGGQGILFASKVLGAVALNNGQHVMGSEV
ncbi:MAG TPA: indolepyruvate ferredoxin oxidoreductase, partial [Synergistales bacterium]|nr:indolepyruvate ferredoxin oxidoreductase [Synergistales bacterium]